MNYDDWWACGFLTGSDGREIFRRGGENEVSDQSVAACQLTGHLQCFGDLIGVVFMVHDVDLSASDSRLLSAFQRIYYDRVR